MPKRTQPSSASPDALLASSVRQLQDLERDLDRQASLATRIGRAASRTIGSLAFVCAHIVGLGAWIAWNLWAPPPWRIDPFPFGMLTMFVSLEGVLLAAFILIAQNHFGQLAERRDRLNLHVDMLAEQQVTLLLRYLQRICDHFGIEQPAHERARSETYAADTNVERLATEIDQAMREP